MDNRYVYNIVAKCFVLFNYPFNFHFNFILYQFIEVPCTKNTKGEKDGRNNGRVGRLVLIFRRLGIISFYFKKRLYLCIIF